jgi:hypothetical protein
MLCGKISRSFSGKVVKFDGRDARIDTGDDFLGNFYWLDVTSVQTVT